MLPTLFMRKPSINRVDNEKFRESKAAEYLDKTSILHSHSIIMPLSINIRAKPTFQSNSENMSTSTKSLHLTPVAFSNAVILVSILHSQNN